jgi:hypothetical protein
MLCQERLDVGRGFRVVNAERRCVRVASCWRKVQQPIQVRAGSLPALYADRTHLVPFDL